MSDKPLHPEQRTIGELYKHIAQETPSKTLDENILAIAKQQMEKTPSPPAKPSGYSKWQWPFSVAASALLVTVLYISNDEHYTAPVDQLNRPVGENVSETAVGTPMEIHSADTQAVPPLAADDTTSDGIQGFSSTPPTPATPADSKEPGRQRTVTHLGQKKEQEQVIPSTVSSHFPEPALPQASAEREETPSVAEEAIEHETIIVTGSRIATTEETSPEAKSQLDNKYLQALVAQINQANELPSETSANFVSRQISPGPQEQLFIYLQDFVKQHPEVAIPDVYLDLLSPKQRAAIDALRVREQ